MRPRIPAARLWMAPLAALLCAIAVRIALADDEVALHVRTVLATDSSADFDSRLSGYRRQLRGLFHYSSYRLVKEEERRCPFGLPNNFEIPGGRYLEVLPMALKEDRVQIGRAHV